MKVMKSIVRWLALGFCACLFVVQASAVTLTATKDYYVNDYAGVLSQDTKDYIITENIRLENASGAQVVVVTLNDTEGLSLDEYTYQLFNAWGIGSKQKDNGVLLVLDIQGQNYHCLQGIGLENTLTTPTISRILQEDLEPDFAVGNYDDGVRKTFDSLAAQVEHLYGAKDSNSSSLADNNFLIYGLAALLIVIAAIKAIVRKISFGLFGGYGGNVGMGMLLGSSMGRSRRNRSYYDRRYNSYRGGSGGRHGGGGHSGGSFGGGGGASRGGGAGRGH